VRARQLTDTGAGIIMNKESSYEMGLQDSTGLLQAAFSSGAFTGGALEGGGNHGGNWVNDEGSYGCWRWWGHYRVPVHEWTHVVVAYDGSNEMHYINGGLAETGACPGDPAKGLKLEKHPENRLKIGARGSGTASTCTADSPAGCVQTPAGSQVCRTFFVAPDTLHP
jgi:hypothetical protein